MLGVGLRHQHFDALLGGAPLPGLDFFEVTPENFLGFGGLTRRALLEARARVPVVTHGVSLSLGGPDPLDEAYLTQVRGLLDALDVPWHSDHVSLSSAHGVEYHDLLPVAMDHATLTRMAARARAARDHLGRPLLLENPTVYAQLPGAEMAEPEFLARLLEASGCKLLLDLNNVWVNALNHGGDPAEYLSRLPEDCVGQYHLAGFRPDEPLAIDSHGARVSDEVRELYRLALQRFGPAWTVLERDHDVPPLAALLDELGELREVAEQALSGDTRAPRLPAARAKDPLPPGDPAGATEALHQVVVGAVDPDQAAERLGVPPEGLRLYRNFFRRHHHEILTESFPVLFSLLDAETSEAMVRGYQAAHPMAHREINANAAALPGWLSERAAQGQWGLTEFHAELAAFERARFVAYVHPSELPEAGSLDGPALNPTLTVLQLRYPVADWVDAWSRAHAAGEGSPPVPTDPLPAPQVLLAYRDPTSLRGRACRGTPALLFAVKMLHDGLTPEEAGRMAGRDAAFAEAALAAAVGQGVAVGAAAG